MAEDGGSEKPGESAVARRQLPLAGAGLRRAQCLIECFPAPEDALKDIDSHDTAVEPGRSR